MIVTLIIRHNSTNIAQIHSVVSLCSSYRNGHGIQDPEGTASTFDAGFRTRSIPLSFAKKIYSHSRNRRHLSKQSLNSSFRLASSNRLVSDRRGRTAIISGASNSIGDACLLRRPSRLVGGVDWLTDSVRVDDCVTSRDRRQDGASRACAVRRRQTNNDVDVLISKLLSTWSSSSPPPAAKTLMYDHRPRRRRCLVATAAADDYVMLMITVLSIFFSHHKRILSSICLLAALSSSGARCVCSSTVNQCLAVMIILLCCTDPEHITDMW